MAPEVRLSGQENEPLGVVSITEALRMAGELDVDLVEIAATAVPPVCRLMDYGKFKYQEQKKAAEAKAKQTVIEIKEIKFRPGTDDGGSSDCASSFWGLSKGKCPEAIARWFSAERL
jgi:translation initiation factor IF-3